jgi:hypothetical protein
MNNPFRTQVRLVREGTPPDYEDALIEVSNWRLGTVIMNYGELFALLEQANDARHFVQLSAAKIRAAKRFGK